MTKELGGQSRARKSFRMRRSKRVWEVQIPKGLREGALGTANDKGVMGSSRDIGTGTDGHEKASFPGRLPVIKKYSNRESIKGQEEFSEIREEGRIAAVSCRTQGVYDCYKKT